MVLVSMTWRNTGGFSDLSAGVDTCSVTAVDVCACGSDSGVDPRPTWPHVKLFFLAKLGSQRSKVRMMFTDGCVGHHSGTVNIFNVTYLGGFFLFCFVFCFFVFIWATDGPGVWTFTLHVWLTVHVGSRTRTSSFPWRHTRNTKPLPFLTHRGQNFGWGAAPSNCLHVSLVRLQITGLLACW